MNNIVKQLFLGNSLSGLKLAMILTRSYLDGNHELRIRNGGRWELGFRVFCLNEWAKYTYETSKGWELIGFYE